MAEKPQSAPVVPIVADAKGRFKPHVAARCSSCLYFKSSTHPTMAAPCSKLGRLGRGIAPKCFVPDVNAVKKHGMQLAGALELITRNLNTPQLQVLGSILMTTGSLRKANL